MELELVKSSDAVDASEGLATLTEPELVKFSEAVHDNAGCASEIEAVDVMS